MCQAIRAHPQAMFYARLANLTAAFMGGSTGL
jgi:TorA maturation chaperone TorD